MASAAVSCGCAVWRVLQAQIGRASDGRHMRTAGRSLCVANWFGEEGRGLQARGGVWHALVCRGSSWHQLRGVKAVQGEAGHARAAPAALLHQAMLMPTQQLNNASIHPNAGVHPAMPLHSFVLGILTHHCVTHTHTHTHTPAQHHPWLTYILICMHYKHLPSTIPGSRTYTFVYSHSCTAPP